MYYIKKTCFLILYMYSLSAFSQKLYPLTYGPEESPHHSSSARYQLNNRLHLPLFDDFNQKNTFADTTMWEPYGGTYINQYFGWQPPSLGVATFDGIAYDGIPYSPNDPSEVGSCDKLESLPIDLTTDNSGLFLSFFYQPSGYGHIQINPGDSLILYFMDTTYLWDQVWSKGIDSTTDFKQVLIPVNDSRYFFEDFKFKFVSYGNRSGMYDLWNLDYVYLDKNRDSSDVYFKDIAISTTPNSYIKEYTAMPFEQYEAASASMVTDSLFTTINDFKDNNGLPIPINKKCVISEKVNSLSFTPLDTTDIINNGARQFLISTEQNPIDLISVSGYKEIETKFIIETSDPTKGDEITTVVKDSVFGTLDTLYMGVGDYLKIDSLEYFLESGDVVNINVGDSVIVNYQDTIISTVSKTLNLTGTVELITTSHNDSVTRVTHIKDYFAYDDGTAEKTFVMDQKYGVVAYKFDLNTRDTITALQFYFPNTSRSFDGESIDLVIWKDIAYPSGVDSILHTEPIAAYVQDTLNKFTTIKLMEEVEVEDHFYVGWLVTGDQETHFGYDANNSANGNIFVKLSDQWTLFNDEGALMIRPIMSKQRFTGTEEQIETKANQLKPFPNPAKNRIYFQKTMERISLLNLNGQVLATTENKKSLNLTGFSSGLYFIRTVYQGNITMDKVLIRK